MAAKGQTDIVVRGARENNLRNLDVTIPRGSLTCVTGVSGSGKSSLAFDTIFKEGQRRFVESLSSYARQFLGQGEKPQVEHMEGLSPSVSIDQKTVGKNPRSTVGTVTEIHDHLRLLFARLGTSHCPKCGKPVMPQSAEAIVARLLAEHDGVDVLVLAPLIRERKGEYRKELEELRGQGFVRARVDGEVVRLDEPITLARYERHTIEVVLDRVRVSGEKRGRLAEAVEKALDLGKGLCVVLIGEQERTFSSSRSCPDCGVSIPELEPRSFSFNSPQGACSHCDGLGIAADADERLIIPDPSLTIDEGAVAPSRSGSWSMRRQLRTEILEQVCDALAIPRDRPIHELTALQRKRLLEGAPDKQIQLDLSYEGKRVRYRSKEERVWRGVIPILRELHETKPGKTIAKYMAPSPCPHCRGTRLSSSSLAVRFRDQDIGQLGAMTVEDLLVWARGVTLFGNEKEIGERLLKELMLRLEFLERVGVGYLTIDRGAGTLSGGEAQRIRLATQVGSKLRGILYVLDEPSIGLHQRDNQRLIETLRELRDAGNTVLVVEHDRETMEASDFIVDVGPGAGEEGGHLVSFGTPAAVRRDKNSVTGGFLAGRETIAMPLARRDVAAAPKVVVRGARENNLRGIDVSLPTGVFTCVTGVSGSGKSTLVDAILRRALAQHFHNAEDRPGAHDGIDGLEHLDKVTEIDQSPIGRTPRSNPATYTQVFGLIRDLFARLPEAQVRGYPMGRFSFNVKGGRCEECGGAGVRLIEMQFLSDVSVPCDVCQGRRFNPETLEIHYKGKSINDVLEMTVKDALAFFETHPKIARVLETLDRVGLGYIRLGQPSTTLSGGEAQRVKLAKFLHRPPTGRTLYLLDEPTTGLHFLDVRRLLLALQALVDAGNTVVVIEHDLDVVKCADWVIDLGPEGGSRGGELVYEGPLLGILDCERSITGQELARHLNPPKKVATARKAKVVDRAVEGNIVIRKASLHNLKDVTVTIPAGEMTVVCGPSGSGKTSLAFDTLFAEGQRRFVECLSTYARQFLGRVDRPPVEEIEGLAPAIAIDQKNAPRNPRSTVATVTEIQDYLRLLFARVGTPHCPGCGKVIQRSAPDTVVNDMLTTLEGKKGRVLAPLYLRSSKLTTTLLKPADLKKRASLLADQGFRRVMIDGVEHLLTDKLPSLSKVKEIWLVIDRVSLKASGRTRLLDSIAQAYERGHGIVAFEDEAGSRQLWSDRPGCADCGVFLPAELSPRMFSFNSHVGACEACHGLGQSLTCSPDRLIARPDQPLFGGALIDRPGDFIGRSDSYLRAMVEAMAKSKRIDLKKPFKKLPPSFQKAVLHGQDDEVAVAFASKSAVRDSTWEVSARWKGLCHYIEEWYRGATSESWAEILSRVMRQDTCSACNGERLKAEFRAVTVGDVNLGKVAEMTVEQAAEWTEALVLDGTRAVIADEILKELQHRLRFLSDVGLAYLGLGRSANSLSGGESQRIRLATQIGNRLTGVIYVLDEPTIGLHQRDTQRLLKTLRDLKDLGNTVVVVEHDRETIDVADWVLDLGPGAGHKGGEVVFQGKRSALASARTLTADYLSGRRVISEPREPRIPKGWLTLKGATANNLKNVEVSIPRGSFVCFTGVSGSGKSSLVMDTLAPAAAGSLAGKAHGGPKLEGVRALDQCVIVDQSPIGSSPRSNPASYVGILDEIRSLMAKTPLAKMRGFQPGRFSFNRGEGRCADCEGRGSIKVEMHFLPDVWIKCELCGGKRFNRETLEVRFREKNIADILAMEVSEAVAFFAAQPRIARALTVLDEVGLGYVTLGQPATTLSGGEAQRIKLARELSTRVRGEVLYILDEPTTGLHFDDVARLLAVLQKLVDNGHTVVVIEHDLDVVRSADYVVDMGPEGGAEGGEVVAFGTPSEVARHPTSHTARSLRDRENSRSESRSVGTTA